MLVKLRLNRFLKLFPVRSAAPIVGFFIRDPSAKQLALWRRFHIIRPGTLRIIVLHLIHASTHQGTDALHRDEQVQRAIDLRIHCEEGGFRDRPHGT
jgi:hypothetical protein